MMKRFVLDDAQRSMFMTAGIDPDTIVTEADYRKAFSAAGDYFFRRLMDSPDQTSKAVLQAFLENRLTDAKALVRRATFEVIEGGQGA